MKIIRLTFSYLSTTKPSYFIVDKIENVSEQPDGKGSIISMVSHNNGGFKVSEKPSEVVSMMLTGPYMEPGPTV